MDMTLAIVLLIAVSLGTANLPFVVQRPYLVVPWAAPGGQCPGGPLRWLESFVFFAVLLALGYLAWAWVGKGFASPLGLVLRIVMMAFLFALVLAYPGWNLASKASKSFLLRLTEVLMFYFLAGLLAFALEASMGNVFVQRWEFFVITLSLFLVMGYPGYVYRYMLGWR